MISLTAALLNFFIFKFILKRKKMISNYAYIICIIFHKVTRICVKCMIKHELQHCRKGRSGEEGGAQH